MLIVVLVVTFIANGLELLHRIMIFDKYAIFVQEMREIVIDTVPLASVLGIIIIAQTVLFWLLDHNSLERNYVGLSGFANCFVDSYRLALGDFEITENFVENSNNIFMFWIVFFAGTILTLLIILNMVIALMSATFERVQGETQSHVLRAKLEKITSNYFRLSQMI